MIPNEESALVRTTLQIFRNWKVDDARVFRILGMPDVGQFKAWQTGAFGQISGDVLDRMALVLAIHTSLRIWFREPARGYAWMHRSNSIFEGLSPIDLIETGDVAAIVRLRAYLEACIEAG